MLAPGLASTADWRPQQFGDRRAATIADPIIEPLWTGPRVLAHVDRGSVRLTDEEGAIVDHSGIETLPVIVSAIEQAMGGGSALFEAFLTREPIQRPADIALGDDVTIQTSGEAMTQLLVGARGDRKSRLRASEEEARLRTVEGATGRLAFVAVDLLWLDDQPLLDVPLLERKRILESVLPESDLVRVGIHVKPPIDPWLGSWRATGFRRLAYKAANSRYLPGRKNQEWALATIPTR